jgi:hypothetical protein
MDIDNEMTMELLMQDKDDTVADHQQRLMVLNALLRY